MKDLNCTISAVAVAFGNTWKWLIHPASWPATLRWLLDWVWRILRPTLIRALCANRQIPDIATRQRDEGTNDREELQNYTPEELALAVNTLFSVYESDQSRVRGIESKAFGALQIAGLVFAGSAFTLRIILDDRTPSPTAIWLVAMSGLYLFASLAAELNVTKLRQNRVLDTEDVLPIEVAYSNLAEYIHLNRRASIKLGNLTESAIFDARRALFFTAAGLVVAIFAT